MSSWHLDCTDSIHLLCSSVEPGVVGVKGFGFWHTLYRWRWQAFKQATSADPLVMVHATFLALFLTNLRHLVACIYIAVFSNNRVMFKSSFSPCRASSNPLLALPPFNWQVYTIVAALSLDHIQRPQSLPSRSQYLQLRTLSHVFSQQTLE